jgi:hypothetical protein
MSQLSIDLLKALIDEPILKRRPLKPAAARKAANAEAVARHREAEQERRAAGVVVYSTPNAREALADAAMHILLSGGEGTEAVRSVLRSVFATQVGAPMTLESHVRSGRIKSRFFKSA